MDGAMHSHDHGNSDAHIYKIKCSVHDDDAALLPSIFLELLHHHSPMVVTFYNKMRHYECRLCSQRMNMVNCMMAHRTV